MLVSLIYLVLMEMVSNCIFFLIKLLNHDPRLSLDLRICFHIFGCFFLRFLIMNLHRFTSAFYRNFVIGILGGCGSLMGCFGQLFCRVLASLCSLMGSDAYLILVNVGSWLLLTDSISGLFSTHVHLHSLILEVCQLSNVSFY